ncbi:MAG: 5'-nucleotidase C-terminal domain-containing protein [Rhodospirillales bacterium]|nr:5'-nucleotidase C-terminal domain-containing protein [Rhodospirillales bacterium]
MLIKHLSRIVVAICFVAALAVGRTGYAQSVDLTLLHVNDVYQVSPDDGVGGLAQLMTLLKKERARSAHTLTTLGGDLLSPSVMSGLLQGAQMIDLFNALKTDMAVLGNHEFDFGPAVLRERMKSSAFPWITSNVFEADGKPFGGGTVSTLKQVGEFKVGIFGLLTPETEFLSSTNGEATFKPVMETAKAMVGELQKQGAQVIIALTHLDFSEDRELASKVKGIDVILGGHDHDPLAAYENGTLIIKAGYDAHYLAVVDLKIEMRESRRGPTVHVRPVWRFETTAGVAADPEMAKRVATYEQKLSEELDVAVGKTTTELVSSRGEVRSRETTMGNLIADALRAGVKADVAITNGGGIRGDKIYAAGSTLTRKDILGELPFGNVTVLIELSGADLRAALENGVSKIEDKAGRFPQVSGLAFTYDAKAAAGSRVTAVTVAGKPIDPAATYKVATSEYMLGGGDGYSSLQNGKTLVDASGATLMATTVMNYISAQGTVSPKVENRIVAQ